MARKYVSKRVRPTVDDFFVGNKIGRFKILTVRKKKSQYSIVVECSCGKKLCIARSTIMDGVQSCGCLYKDREEMNARIGESHKGLGRHNGIAFNNRPEYQVWLYMLRRCSDSESDGYKNYGGRGIKVCDRWVDSFTHFLADMGKRPNSSHTIERKNNDGDYGPDNCYWATRHVQSRNTRRNVNITYNGETKCLKDWAASVGINYCTLRDRLAKGIPFEKAIRRRK